MSFTYIPNIPLSTEKPSISQPKITDNFQALDQIFGQNHVKYSAASNNGYHTAAQFTTSIADPTTTNIGAIYTKTVSGNPELFWKQTTAPAIQMTSGSPNSNANGYTFLPGGMLMQWGIF